MSNARIPTLKEMEGERILAMIPLLKPEVFELVTLHRVEEWGIWIEHQETTDKILAHAKVKISPKTVIVFFPWSSVTAIFGSRDVPALSTQVLA